MSMNLQETADNQLITSLLCFRNLRLEQIGVINHFQEIILIQVIRETRGKKLRN